MSISRAIILSEESSDLREFISKYGSAEYDAMTDEEKRGIEKFFKDKKAVAKTTTSSGGSSFSSSVSELLETQSQQRNNFSTEEYSSISDALNIITGQKDIISVIQGQINTQLKQEAELHTKINEGVGLQGDLSKDFRGEIINAYPDVLRLGYGMSELGDYVKTTMELSGRFNIVNADTLKSIAGTSRAFVGDIRTMGQHINQFMNIGLGAKDASEAINKAGIESLHLGLNSKKTTEILMANLSKINEYGFKNGVEGLNRMVQKSLEFRMNIDETFKIAEKVWNPEGAIDLSANLQVIGGAIGSFNDPLRMMYMATNDVGGLQEALIEAASGLATYNEEQKRFEVTGVNLRRAKAMADSLGISMSELTKGAIASSERLEINSQLLSKGFNISDEQREFIANMAQMKDGKMTIEVPKDTAAKMGIKEGMFDLSSAKQNELDVLLNYQTELKDNYKTAEQVSRGQLNALENINRDVSYIMATLRVESSKIIRDELKGLGYDQETVTALMSVMTDKVVNGTILPTISDVKALIKEFSTEGSEVRKMLVAEKIGETKAGQKLKEDSKQATESVKKTTSETTSNVNIRMTSDGFMDVFARELQKTPEVWQDHIETNSNHYTTTGAS